MFIYKNQEFTENTNLKLELEQALDDNNGDYEKTIKSVGFSESAIYCYGSDVDLEDLFIHMYMNDENGSVKKTTDNNKLTSYSFIAILGVGGGCFEEVAIKNSIDKFDFLEKYLPIIKLAGELNQTETR